MAGVDDARNLSIERNLVVTVVVSYGLSQHGQGFPSEGCAPLDRVGSRRVGRYR